MSLQTFLFGRYDVELFQRIEQLVGKKMPLFRTEEEEVMQLQERVAEAQRIAATVSRINAAQAARVMRL